MVGKKALPEDDEPQETASEPEVEPEPDTEPEPEVESEEGETEDNSAPETEQPEKTAETQKPRDELKVVVIMKADSVMIGAQSPSCDPVYKTLKGDLAAALAEIPGLVAEAKAKWDANPRYPKADLPEPTPTPTPARTTTAAPSRQPSFF